LLPQAFPHLRAEHRPIVGAYVRLETRSQQRANRRKHRLAAVHAHRALRSGPRSRPWRRRLRRWGRLCLHLRWHWRRGLSRRRQRHHRAQSNHRHLSFKFFHAFCRSPHSGQSLSLTPLVAVLRTEGHIWERSMSSHKATAYCQSTSPQRTPSRNPASSLQAPLPGTPISRLAWGFLDTPRIGLACQSRFAPPVRIAESVVCLWDRTLDFSTPMGQRLRLPSTSANSGDAS
jgi:hypothetical protein